MTNGLTKPSERFSQEIEPALADYINGPRSERLANNLARAIDHHVDWTFDYYSKVDPSRLKGAGDVKSFRRQLLQQCSELQIVNDLSDAAHHRFLTWPNNPPRIVDTSTAAYVDAGALYVQNFGPFLPAATNAVDFWRLWKD
jgi:hypothetical protein